MDTDLFLDSYGIAYGSEHDILAWHRDLSRPVLLTSRPEPVTSLLFHDNTLYDAGCYRNSVKETMSGKRLGKCDVTTIYRFVSFRDRILSIGQKEILLGNGESHFEAAVLSDVASGETIAQFRLPSKEDGLSLRPCSLDLATDKDWVYLASQNVVRLQPYGTGPLRLTDYMTDFVHLASDGQHAFSVVYHNDTTNPDGTEIRGLPNNRRIAYWNTREGQIYVRRAALLDGYLVLGARDSERDEQNIHVVRLTDTMESVDGGSPVEPTLLVRRAFAETLRYGKGNPLAIVPKRYLEEMLRRID